MCLSTLRKFIIASNKFCCCLFLIPFIVFAISFFLRNYSYLSKSLYRIYKQSF